MKFKVAETLVVHSSEIVLTIEGRNFVVDKQAHELFKMAVALMEQGDDKGSIAAYMKSALRNHPIALNRMGHFYLDGDIVPQDFNEAVKCFISAASQKLVTAQISLGLCLINGVGVEQNVVEAIQMFISVPKEQCSPEILMIIADSYHEGINGVGQNYQKALEYYEIAASKGNQDASKAAMAMYLYGKGCKKNFEKVVTYSEPLEKLAKEPELLEYLGSLYQKGDSSRKPDFQKALQCYKLACENGSASATYNLATLYYENKLLKNMPKAIKYFQQSADKGYSPGQYFWGALHLEGKLVSQDFSVATKYFTLAAEDNNSNAFYMLGECYSEGKGFEIDLLKAVEFYKKAEDKQPKAQLALGHCYLEGKVVTQDTNIAFEYFKKAASKDLAAAKQIYGLCLLHGIGCKPDLKKAKEYLEKAEKLAINEAPMEPAIIKGYLTLGVRELKLCAAKDFERKRFPFAFAHYERALQKAENKTIKKDLLLEIAALQIQIQDYDAALNNFEKVLEILPNYQEALRKKIVCLGLKKDDKTACFLVEKHSKVLLPFVKEHKELWAERIYKLYLDRQGKKAERLAAEKLSKTAKILARKEKENLANTQEKSTVPPIDEDSQQTDVLPQVQEEQASLPEKPVEIVPQISASNLQQEAEKQAKIPVKISYPKVEIPEQISKIFLDIKQRIGAQSLLLIGSAALDLILRAVFVNQTTGLKEPKNWNFFTMDPVENLTLIHGQFPQTPNPKLYNDNSGLCSYEKPINLYCDKFENIGLFSIHQLAVDSEGNIIGSASAFEDLKKKILRFIRPAAQMNKEILNTFLVKFSGSEFTLLKTNSSTAQMGIFAQAPTRSEAPNPMSQQSEKVFMTSSKSQHTLCFSALTDSKTRLAGIKKDLGQLVGTLVTESDLDFNSKCETKTKGNLFRVEFLFKFKSLADLEKMQQLVNDIGLFNWDESNKSELK